MGAAGLIALLGPRYLKWQVRQATQARQFDTASITLDRLERWFGVDGESSYLRARLCRKRGDWTGVRDSLLRAKELHFPVNQLEREQWLTLAQTGQLRLAEPFLARLLTDPREDGAEICEAYVNGFFLNYRMPEALQLLDAWIADYPRDPEPLLIRSKIRVEQQFLKEAEADLRTAWSLDRTSSTAALELADVLVLERRIDEALTIYQQVSTWPTHPERAELGAAKALRLMNQLEAARSISQELVQRGPDDREALLELALADLELNRHAEAVITLKKALTLNPRSLVVRQALARALRAIGDHEAAREHAEYVADAQAALQRADKLTVQVSQHPNDIEARYEIGMIYLRYAVPERGIQWLKSVLNYDPNHQAATRALKEYAQPSEQPSTNQNQSVDHVRKTSNTLPESGAEP